MSSSAHEATFEIEVGLELEDAFAFFSAVGNLNRVTPGWFRLDPQAPPPEQLHAGATIDYRFRYRLLRMRWRTRITVWQPPTLFVYEQARGPYRSFVHEHHFEPTARGTLVTDVVRFRTAGGGLAARWIVAPELRRIFSHRADVASRLFPVDEGARITPAGSALEEPA